jgi:hypothetical protein
VRRETGKEQVVKVHCDEGGADRIGPEPCEHARESMGEASAGERTGQPLSLDKNSNPDAVVVHWAEGKTDGARHRECPDDRAWSEPLLRRRADWSAVFAIGGTPRFIATRAGLFPVDWGGDVETIGERGER